MRSLKTLMALGFPVLMLFSCSGSNAANAVVDSSSAALSAVAGSGDDMYYEMTTVSTGEGGKSGMVMEMFVSSKGDMRVEMHLNNSAKINQAMAPMVLIGHADKPNESISIDDAAKTYTVNQIDPADLNTGIKTETTVTKIGQDKVLGFNAVHAKIISHEKLGSFYNVTDTIDVWRSEDVPMQSNVKALFTQFESRSGSFIYSKETAARLKDIGCEGFLVKMTVNGRIIPW